MENTGSGFITSHVGTTENGSFGESLKAINGGLECHAVYVGHKKSTVSRLEKYCRAANLLEVAPLRFDGCEGLDELFDSCTAGGAGGDGRCPSCDAALASPATSTWDAFPPAPAANDSVSESAATSDESSVSSTSRDDASVSSTLSDDASESSTSRDDIPAAPMTSDAFADPPTASEWCARNHCEVAHPRTSHNFHSCLITYDVLYCFL